MPTFAAASPRWGRGLRFTPSRVSGFRSIRAAGITPFTSAPGPSPTCPGCWRCSCALNHEDAKITKAHENYKYLRVLRVFVMTEPRRRLDSALLLPWAPCSVSGQHQVIEVQVTRPDELGVPEILRVVGVRPLVRHFFGRPDDGPRPARIVEARRRPGIWNRPMERLAGLWVFLSARRTHRL